MRNKTNFTNWSQYEDGRTSAAQYGNLATNYNPIQGGGIENSVLRQLLSLPQLKQIMQSESIPRNGQIGSIEAKKRFNETLGNVESIFSNLRGDTGSDSRGNNDGPRYLSGGARSHGYSGKPLDSDRARAWEQDQSALGDWMEKISPNVTVGSEFDFLNSFRKR